MIGFDTICAECTAPYKSALSIVRLSGKDAKEIVSHIVKKDVNSFVPSKAYHLSLYENIADNSLIDSAVVIFFEAEHSFCGEDTFEFYTHGSRIIVNQLLEALIKYGARRAEGGEFSYKAYFNGNMELVESEAINDVINARTKRSKDFALKTLNGENSKVLNELKEKLNLLTAEIEVNIDYPEFDEEEDLENKTRRLLPAIIKIAKDLMVGSHQSVYLFNGVKIAIVGEPNVGKSTLLNKILGYDKAIVTSVPGTTRDVVEGEKEIDGIIYKFLDTAGIREQADEIEKIGISKSIKTTKEADIILVLSDKGNFDSVDLLGIEEEIRTKPVIYVGSKRDVATFNSKADILISKDDSSLDQLFTLIKSKLDLVDEDKIGFTSKRDVDNLTEFVNILDSIEEDLNNYITIDVIEIKLVEASKKLDELIGRDSTMEDIYDTIFKNFCIGK